MKEQRIKTGTMMKPSIIKLCDENLIKSNTKSRNDFIEEAVLFYVGYLNQEQNIKYISNSIENCIKGNIQITEDRISKLLFKLSVELSMMMNVVAASNEIEPETLDKLRLKCVNDVKATIGNISFKEIFKYQKNI